MSVPPDSPVRRCLLLDRDGTIVREPADYRVDAIRKVDFLPYAAQVLAELRAAGFRLVLVSNQDGLGAAGFTYTNFAIPHRFIMQYLEWSGADFEAELIDHHRPEDNHPDRKPAPGMVLRWLAGRSLDPETCWVIGDRRTDAWLAHNLGVASLTIRDPLSADGNARCPDVPPAPTTEFSDWREIRDFLLARSPA